jgi:transcriptional regulator NrdR family protein
MTPRWVRKRDGRRVPFDARKLGNSIAAAARAAGEEARVPAEEIGEIVALFLEQRLSDRIPDTSDLEDLVEKALLETGHSRTAAVYAERIKARARTRLELVVHREGSPVAPDGEPLPAPPGEPWSEGKIVAALERRRVPAAVAEEVAAAVEQKVFGLGWKRIPASLVREILNAELAARGMSAHIGRPGELSVPTEEVRGLLVAAYVRRAGGVASEAPGGAEAAVGQDVLARFALAEIYPPPVADAHLDGRIHIQDLGRPLRLTSAAVALDALKARTRGLADGAPASEGPATLGELGERLARTLAALAENHARVVAVPYANVFLAPYLRRKDAAARRDLLEWARLLPSGAARPLVRLHLGPVPPAIARAPVVGPRGRRWRATYGDLAPEAERCARLLLEMLGGEGADRGLGVVLGLVPEGAAAPGLPSKIAIAPPVVAACLEAGAFEPQRSRGLASAAELLAAASSGRPVAAGAAGVVALNCLRAAAHAGPGDEPALRAELFRAADLAVEALAAKWAFLEPALYKPRLPLWEQAGAASGDERAKEEPARAPAAAAPAPASPAAPAPAIHHAPPSDRAAVDAAAAMHVVALVGFLDAIERVLGEPPAANAAVAAAAGDLARALAAHLREQGARRGLKVRLEEPEIERGRRRLTDLDLVRAGGAAGGDGGDEDDADLRYSHGLGGALVDALYAPVGFAPFLEGGDLARRIARLLERSGRAARAAGAGAGDGTGAPTMPDLFYISQDTTSRGADVAAANGADEGVGAAGAGSESAR